MADNNANEIYVDYEGLKQCADVIRKLSVSLEDVKRISSADMFDLSFWDGKAKSAFIEKYTECISVADELLEQQRKNAEVIDQIVELYGLNEDELSNKTSALDASDIF